MVLTLGEQKAPPTVGATGATEGEDEGTRVGTDVVVT